MKNQALKTVSACLLLASSGICSAIQLSTSSLADWPRGIENKCGGDGYICQPAKYRYDVQIGQKMGTAWSTGKEACFAATGDPTSYWGLNPPWGEGCFYTDVNSNANYGQNWALRNFSCYGTPEDSILGRVYEPIGGVYVCESCAPGFKKPFRLAETCLAILDRWHEPKQCGVGNPIYPLIGSKRQPEELGRWLAGVEPVGVTYDSRRKVPANDSAMLFSVSPSPSFGELWGSTLHKQLVRQAGVGASASPVIQASRGGGTWISFTRNSAGDYVPADAGVQDRIVVTATGWRYVDAASQAVESYDIRGLLQSISHAQGSTRTYSYSTAVSGTAPQVGLLMKVQDQFGRSVQFEYEAGSGTPRISRVIDPSGAAVVPSYDASGNLSRITWPDTSWRQFLYERPDLSWALTAGRLHVTYLDAEPDAVVRNGGLTGATSRAGTAGNRRSSPGGAT